MRVLRPAVKIIVPIVILVYLFHRLDMVRLWSLVRTLDMPLFLASFAILCLRNVLGAYRSSVLLRFRGLRYGVGVLTRYYFIGNFFNLFMPEVIGRDLARGWYLFRSSAGRQESITAIVVERFIGIAALMVMSLAAVAAGAAMGPGAVSNDTIRAVAIVFALGCIAMTLFFHPTTDRILERLLPHTTRESLHRAVGFIRDIVSYNRAPVLVHTFITSLVFQFAGVVATLFLARSLGDATPAMYFIILLPVVWMLGMLPVSINGLGVREGSFVVLFASAGMSGEMALAISLLWFAQNVGLGLIGGVLLLTRRRERGRQ